MANFNLNHCEFAGRLTHDPELKATPSGQHVTSFSMAVNRKHAKKDENGQKVAVTDFFNVVAWESRADLVCQYFKKGSSIYVAGELQTRKYTDKDGVTRYVTELLAEDVRFVDSKTESPGAAPAATAAATVPQNAGYVPQNAGYVPQFEQIPDDEELPF